jgi:hypothetical protein
MFMFTYPLLLHFSALIGNLQAEYTIDCWKLLHLQWIRCSTCFMYCLVTILQYVFGKSCRCQFEHACKVLPKMWIKISMLKLLKYEDVTIKT